MSSSSSKRAWRNEPLANVLRAIVGFRLDEEGQWVAELACGHTQHVRHQPPWQVREWTQTQAGRESRLGTTLDCPLCDPGR
jgi:hypothetical protein